MNRKIYLIRHGETAWTVSKQHTGLTDIPLTEHGRTEAKQLGEKLKHLSFQKILLSPLARAVETCKLANFFQHAEIDPDLVEWNYGDYEGLTHEQIRKQDPNWSIFTKGAPGGESVADVGKRADRVLSKISQISGDVALFSSGHFLRLLAARWLNLPPSEGRLFFLSTASLSILGYERESPVILLWNSRVGEKDSL